MEELSEELKERVALYGSLIINGRLYVPEPAPETPAKKAEKPSTEKEGE
jgi:hypothetical protein